MKRSCFITAIIIVVILLLQNISLLSVSAQDEMTDAQKAAQSFVSSSKVISMYTNWKGSSLAGGQACYDMKNQLIAFLFTVMQANQAVGRIVVGSSATSITC